MFLEETISYKDVISLQDSIIWPNTEEKSLNIIKEIFQTLEILVTI